jgi:hypothetical protein
MANDRGLEEAMEETITRWMSWRISRATGIPRGLPYRSGLVAHFGIMGEIGD